jgi:hypothetical protein
MGGERRGARIAREAAGVLRVSGDRIFPAGICSALLVVSAVKVWRLDRGGTRDEAIAAQVAAALATPEEIVRKAERAAAPD